MTTPSLRAAFPPRTGETPVLYRLSDDLDRASPHRALQRLVESGFGLLVFLLRDSALLMFDFELEDLFLQGVEQ